MISWEYLAGIIDGEGSIGTTKTGQNRNIVGRVTVANTDKRLLYALRDSFGGSVTIRANGHVEGWKPFGSITWTNRQAEQILENVLPFLIIKRDQANLCLELIRMKNVPKSERCDYIKTANGTVTARLKTEVTMKEEKIAEMIRTLNAKGVRA